MECTFQSLPFLVPESQRPALLAWKEAAIQTERRLAARRQEQLLQLKQQISLRLLQHQSNRKNQLCQLTMTGLKPSNQPNTPEINLSNQTLEQSNLSNQLQLPLEQSNQLNLIHQPKQHSNQRQKNQEPPSSVTGGNWSTLIYSKPLPQSGDYPTEPTVPRPQGEVYSRVTAMVRGFLTRRLLHSSKISSLISTIQDGEEVLAGLTEPLSPQDIGLRDRVHTQVQLARMKLLDVVHLPVGERMAFISHERFIRTQRKEREKVVSGAGRRGRLSTATQRALQRRQESLTAIPSPTPTSTRSKPVSKAVRQESLATPTPGSTRTKPVSKPVKSEPPNTKSPPTRSTRTKLVSKSVGASTKKFSAEKRAKTCPIGQGTRTLQTRHTAPLPVQSEIRTVKTKSGTRTSVVIERRTHASTGTPASGHSRSGQVKSGHTQSKYTRSRELKATTHSKRPPATSLSRNAKNT